MAPTPRILVVSTNRWPSAGRLSLALRAVGLDVAALCPGNSPLHTLRSVAARFRFRSFAPVWSVKRAIAASSPSLLVCTDDRAVRAVIALYRQVMKLDDPVSRAMVTLIERSLGNVANLEATFEKSDLTALAGALGLQCPATTVIDSAAALESALASVRYPVFVKSDDAWGGRGVRIVQTERELRAWVRALLLPTVWPSIARRFLGPLVWLMMFRWLACWPKKISLQQVIEGRPANRAVACWQGKVLGGASVVALKTAGAFGPATVVQVIEHDGMNAMAERITANLGLSGLIGFDFMLDEAGGAWLLEMNPRATPICHLPLPNGNLPAVLASALAHSAADVPLVHHDTIALFPGEAKATARPALDAAWYHDIPWDEPAFVEACLRTDFSQKLRGALGMRAALPSAPPIVERIP